MYAYAALSQGSLMPPTLPTIMSRAEAGAYFKELRASRKLRLQDVVDGTTVPTVQYLSALEGGRYNPLNSDHFPSLVQFYRLPREEIERIRPGTIVEVVAAPDPDQSALDLVRLGGTPINTEYLIPMLGDVAAGGRNTGFPNMQFDETIDAGRELAERYGISYLYALRVTGDSMYSERARFSVPDGSTLIVHRELEPVRGDIVVAYIEDLDLGVVKEYGEPEDVTLSSYNPTGPLYRANQHRIRLCGVVVEARHKPRTRRNGTH